MCIQEVNEAWFAHIHKYFGDSWEATRDPENNIATFLNKATVEPLPSPSAGTGSFEVATFKFYEETGAADRRTHWRKYTKETFFFFDGLVLWHHGAAEVYALASPQGELGGV